MNAQVTAANQKDHCLSDLMARILSTDLPPGTALDETRLAAEYGMSRTPMREVLQRLAGRGFADLQDNRGAKVTSMDISVLRTFFQTAPLVYANIARLAAENRTEAQIKQLKATQLCFTKANAAEDAAAAALENHRFHEIIGQMAHNPYLLAALNRMLIDHTRLSQTFYRPTTVAEHLLVTKAQDQHDEMIAAFEAQQTDLATELTLQHWDLSRDQMERYVRPDPLPWSTAALAGQPDAV